MKHGTAIRTPLCATLTRGALVAFALTLLVIASACIKPSGDLSTAIQTGANQPIAVAPAAPPADPISQFVRRIHEDRRGHLWLGTNGDGVARWNGKALEYFSLPQGFGGVAVRGIVEGADGSLWFGTEGGLTKFDGASFTNYTVRDGLVSDDVWCLAFDRRGDLWVGTLQGVCRFDGARFTPFELPEAEPDPTVGVTSARMVRSITEDRAGRLWFGTNGGAYVYDGRSLRNYNEADGLANDIVNSILEDRNGRVWFATHHNGVCYLEGETFTAVTDADGVQGTEVWDLFLDRAGEIWFPVENVSTARPSGATMRPMG
ncbi:MAG: two-component regulator propeller domain-containing protein [Candidatus Delongbacteria bacterium]